MDGTFLAQTAVSGSVIIRRVCGMICFRDAVSPPHIGPLQALDQDLRPQQTTLTDAAKTFKGPNTGCCHGMAMCGGLLLSHVRLM